MLIYLLPGIGCDARLFSYLHLPGHRVKVLEWPAFPKGCTLRQLAQRMSADVDAAHPHILAGVSMGGMVAQEMAALTNPEKVILISTWTGPHEWPWYVHAANTLRLAGLVGQVTMAAFWPVRRLLGIRPKHIDSLLWDMVESQTPRKVRHGLSAVFRWPGSPWKGPTVRIHGDKDRVIPLRFPVDHVIRGGEHIMVLTRPDEVSRAILGSIDQAPTA